MKKLILLALVALVAGAAFATTAPAFTGEFEYTTQFDFDDEVFNAAASPDATINLNGVIDEWSTVNAEIEGTTIDSYQTQELIASTDAAGVNYAPGDVITGEYGSEYTVVAGDAYDATAVAASIGTDMTLGGIAAGTTSTNRILQVTSFSLTTDVTGALGVDGPVSVSITWGALTFQAEDYSGKAGYGDIEVPEESATYIGTELTFAIMDMVNLVVSIAPSTYTDWDSAGDDEAVFGVEAQFMVVDGLDLNAWYLTDKNEGFNQIGLTAGYGSDMINVGAAFAMDLDADTTGFGVSAQYVMDVITAGVAFSAAGLATGVDFADVAAVGVNVTFIAVPDVLDLFAAASIPFADISDNLGIEAGLDFFLGATTYTLGYEYNTVDFNAPDNGADDGMFFKVYAAF